MSNNNKQNKHRDDIDDFFSQFDQPVSSQSKSNSMRKSATIHGRKVSAPRPSADRTGSKVASNSTDGRAARPQSDRDAAKAARKSIAANQPGARRYASENNMSQRPSSAPKSKRSSSSRRNPSRQQEKSPSPKYSQADRSRRESFAGGRNSAGSAASAYGGINEEYMNSRQSAISELEMTPVIDSNKTNSSSNNKKSSKKSARKQDKFNFSSSRGKGSDNDISRRKGGPRSRKPQTNKQAIIKLIIAACMSLVMAVGIYVAVSFLTAPIINTDNIYEQLSQRSVLYDDQGKEIDNLYFEDGNRTIVKYDQIPENMVNAIIAIEDKKFWNHNGFNFIRMAGAIKDKFVGGGRISGTSTVTQQLARNVYLSDIKSQRSLGRKLQEMYITIVIEKNMSKEQIMEAYLNSIYLGFNSYGVQAAAQAYFSKDAKDLTLLECASLGALPKSPDSYALVKTVYSNSTTSSLPVISSSPTVTYLYNGDLSETRRNAILENMCEEGFISEQEKNEALNTNLQKQIKIGTSSDAAQSSYFTDYCIDEVCEDLMNEFGVSSSDAKNMIYTSGLKIQTTMDSRIQDIVEEEFAKDSNYSGIGYVRRNAKGDVLDSKGSVLLYAYSEYFDDNDNFTLAKNEYKTNSDGGITIFAGRRLALYDTQVGDTKDISIEFKSMYTNENGKFYSIENGALSIPATYKSSDSSGNCVISGQFFKDYPKFFVKSDKGLTVKKGNYSLKQKIRQPQAATSIIENETGQIKALMGGRGATGKQLFNRATSPRQPGSNIKPIGVYGPALQLSLENMQEGREMDLDTSEGSDWGNYITAGSQINDKAMQYGGKTWPKNWYSGFKGRMSLRKSVEQSVNVNAVKTYLQIGPDYSASMLKKAGISTIDEEGSVNDLNPAALALGGMTSGISPLEITAAYAVFPSGGVYREPISYTKVINNKDEVILQNTSHETKVYDEGVAWIMTDILRTTVTHGLGSAAAFRGQPVGGKTGTTTDSYDLWFTGFTPQYTAALWQGNDINIELSAGSSQSARFWRAIMSRVCEGMPRATFPARPNNIEQRGGEYYIIGTYSKTHGGKDEDESESTETTVTLPTETLPTETIPTQPPTPTQTTPPQTENTDVQGN